MNRMALRLVPRYVLLIVVIIGLGNGWAQTQTGSSTADAIIWSGESAGFRLHWSTSDLIVTKAVAQSPEFLATRQIAVAAWKQYMVDKAPVPYQFERTDTLLSVVGPLISLRTSEYCDCGGAHPTMITTFQAIDLQQSANGSVKVAALSDLFPEADILNALMSDGMVQKALGSQTGRAPPSLAKLLNALADKSVDVRDCSYAFSKELLSQFAIHHLEANQVAIRLALPHSVETCRGKFIQLGILLPIPASLRQHLRAAQARQQGFLMQDVRRIAGSRQTTVTFQSE